MADATGISWTDATFNPWLGCEKVSPGCAHCYAETLAENRMGLHVWGADAPRRITAEATWKKPLRWARLARDGKLPDGTENQDGHRPRIFCASMADVFEERADLREPRLRLVDLICETPELDWLILTKRPEFARDWWAWWRRDQDGTESPPGTIVIPTNVWMGVSIENARHTWRADVLREIPAAMRFISAEPLLGSVFKAPSAGGRDGDRAARRLAGPASDADGPALTEASARRGVAPLDLTGIDWVIVGGESGSRAVARPMHPEWVREVRDECQRIEERTGSRPALHFKQWGSWTPAPFGYDDRAVFVTRDGRLLPPLVLDAQDVADADGAARMRYAGAAPGSGGKFLDGADWCEIPEGRLTPA